MSTLQAIQEELLTLPGDLQKKVLAYVEWLKYRELRQQSAELAAELGGIQSFAEEEPPRLAEPNLSGLSPDELQERIEITQRVREVLLRIQAGTPGVSTQTLKTRVQQWRNR